MFVVFEGKSIPGIIHVIDVVKIFGEGKNFGYSNKFCITETSAYLKAGFEIIQIANEFDNFEFMEECINWFINIGLTREQAEIVFWSEYKVPYLEPSIPFKIYTNITPDYLRSKCYKTVEQLINFAENSKKRFLESRAVNDIKDIEKIHGKYKPKNDVYDDDDDDEETKY